MNEVTTVALKCLIMIITVVITSVVIPFVRSKIGEDKWNKLQDLADYAVRCAEQKYTPEQWQEKKHYVYGYILRKAEEYGMSLSEEDIDVLVEGVVNAVKH